MTTNSASGAYSAGRRDAMRSEAANAEGHYKKAYMKGYRRHTRKKAKALPPQPTGKCDVCGVVRDERDFGVYDVAADCFFCDTVCEAMRNWNFRTERQRQ